MNQKRWQSLLLGSVLESEASGNRFVVTDTKYGAGGRVIGHTATRTVEALSPKDWKVVPARCLKPRPPKPDK